MKTWRNFSLLTLLAGAVLLTAGLACGGGDNKSKAAEATTPAETPTNTASPTATATSTPTATPTPFAGKVARMKIPRFGVDAPIEELAVNSNNELETPTQENTDVGWYHIYDRPGWNGNAVFSAHVYYHNIPAPFQKLSQANDGDEIQVEMENGATYTYSVISNTRYSRDTIPMGDIIWPQNRPADEQWITMITCGGELDSTGWEYLSRDVIVAKRIS